MAMTQRTLYKTIEKIGTQQYGSEEEMLTAILREVVNNDRINIIGGRIWKLDPERKGYTLIYEEGNIEAIGIGFRLSIKEYEVFDRVAISRTVIADETHKALRKKGIIKYSATGIGDTYKIGRHDYYEYIMAFNTVETDTELRYILSIAGQAVTQMLENSRNVAEIKNLETEMESARALQRMILPEHEFRFGQYEMYGISLPERTVGGDFFNYYRIPGDDERVAVAIGDAASKGLPAAVQALFASGALMMSVEFESKMSSMMRRLNSINYQIFPREKFLTLFYCEIFNGKKGLLLYCNAGHSHPIHYHAQSKECSLLSATGPVIGLLPDAQYTVSNSNIMKDDVLVLYTDGITEANDGENEYEEPRLIEVIRKHAHKSAKEICQEILQDVQVYSANGEYSDDKTVVVIKRNK